MSTHFMLCRGYIIVYCVSLAILVEVASLAHGASYVILGDMGKNYSVANYKKET